MPVVNSELISSTPREPRISWAKAMPEVGTVTARSPPWAAMASAASGSGAAASANWPVPQADSAPNPTMTTTVEASRIRVDSRVRNLMNSEFSTRRKLGPGPELAPARSRGVPAGSRRGGMAWIQRLLSSWLSCLRLGRERAPVVISEWYSTSSLVSSM